MAAAAQDNVARSLPEGVVVGAVSSSGPGMISDAAAGQPQTPAARRYGAPAAARARSGHAEDSTIGTHARALRMRRATSTSPTAPSSSTARAAASRATCHDTTSVLRQRRTRKSRRHSGVDANAQQLYILGEHSMMEKPRLVVRGAALSAG